MVLTITNLMFYSLASVLISLLAYFVVKFIEEKKLVKEQPRIAKLVRKHPWVLGLLFFVVFVLFEMNQFISLVLLSSLFLVTFTKIGIAYLSFKKPSPNPDMSSKPARIFVAICLFFASIMSLWVLLLSLKNLIGI